jgi:cell wall-associated NlpC family hydrolase
LSKLKFTKKQNGKLDVAPKKPGRAAIYATQRKLNRAVDDNDNMAADENVGIEALGSFGHSASGVSRTIGSQTRNRKAKARRAKGAANGVKSKRPRGKPNAKAINKAAQKKRIKRGYAKSARSSGTQRIRQSATTAKNVSARLKEAASKTVSFAIRHWKVLGIVIAVVLIFALAFSALSSCGSMVSGGFQSVITSSYTSEDADIEQVDSNYRALEADLSTRVAGIEGEYPGYDEYRYNIAQIGHDPFELASYLTAKYQTYTPEMVAVELERLFGQQYALTITPTTETRYRVETRTVERTDPDTGEVYEVTETVQVAYSYRILNVTLTNKSLGTVALANLCVEQTEMYHIYMETKGNKGALFADNPYVGGRDPYTDYEVPPEALTDTKFAAMLKEAEKYLGYPYVWGGASPSTSFDCSGYVSWVINHSGWDMGRLTAQGLMDRCAAVAPSEARPGDLIFFQGTYDTAGASHVGIYVGGNMMIHCGNPISYASVNTSYWQSHFYCYGRLP